MEKVLKIIKDSEEARTLFGTHDENLKLIEKEMGVAVTARGTELKVHGEAKAVSLAERLFEELMLTLRKGGVIKKHELLYAIKSILEDKKTDIHSIYSDKIEVSSKKAIYHSEVKGPEGIYRCHTA